MNDRRGLPKATTLRNNGVIPHRPCSASGLDDVEHHECGLPAETQEWVEDEERGRSTNVTTEATEDDIVAMEYNQAGGFGGADAWGTASSSSEASGVEKRSL